MYFYLHDRLGSVRLVIDDTGTAKNSYTYNAFGESFDTETAENVTNPFKFTGQYYLRARQYDPALMRFTSRDPVRGKFEQPMTHNVYLYCLNDPVNKVDPSGRFGASAIVWLNSDRFRRGYLEHFGRIYEGLNRSRDITALAAMATLTDMAASFYGNRGASRDGFMEDLLWMFTEYGPGMERASGNLNLRFDSTGFAGRYQDGHRGQVRHFIGCLGAGYYFGSLGKGAVWYNELRNRARGFSWADVRLGYAGVDLGRLIDGDVWPSGLGADIIGLGDVENWMLDNL